ncbi:unnamed protein product [Moneuplotes crassus]|uniref:non-specific serine/threonine protein kinase n=1 Tax=Euplotes crassus TaxID=5936 RepID=A0AAD1UCF1_EUPCR|nr:unnamed protein product [Moneuplotes crassus]
MESKPSCNICSQPSKKTCSRCLSVYYCSGECQKQDWKTHKKACFSPKLDEELRDNSKNLKADDFEEIRKIGEGNFSKIILVEYKKTGKNYAMKLIEKLKVKNLRKELDVLHEKLTLGKLPDSDDKVEELTDGEEKKETKELDSSIVNPMRVVKLCATFQDELNLYLIQENLLDKGGKEVWEYCRSFGLENHKVVEYTFYQICKAVQQTHYFQILHRDLKPENMFYTPDRSIVKLVDFGSSMFVDNPELRKAEIDNHPKRNKFVNFVGTPNFMAPECAHNKETSYASDIWSLGCILYQLYCGINCFRGGSEYLIFLKSTEAEYEYPSSSVIPSKARLLISEMIQIDPSARIPLDSLLSSSYFDEVRDLTHLPEISAEEQVLVEIKKDIIKRHNVYKLDSQEVFMETIRDRVVDRLGEEYYNENKDYIEHTIKIGRNYVYDLEWKFEEEEQQENEAKDDSENKSENEAEGEAEEKEENQGEGENEK